MRSREAAVFFWYNTSLMKKREKKQKRRRSFSYYFGTFLLCLSFAGFVFIFYPLLSVYFFPPKINEQEFISADFTLEIPVIDAKAKIIKNVDPFNEVEYRKALKKGVAQAAGTGLPGEKRMMFLFAHSAGYPWDMTWYNTIFLRLGELRKNDMILINYKGRRYTYAVTQKKEVWPSETGYLLKPESNDLIIQTCVPLGTALKRLLVFAKPLN